MIRENDLNKYEILSGSMLKTIALISMLIDHTAVALLSSTAINVLSIGPLTISLYTVMLRLGEYVGRIKSGVYRLTVCVPSSSVTTCV